MPVIRHLLISNLWLVLLISDSRAVAKMVTLVLVGREIGKRDGQISELLFINLTNAQEGALRVTYGD